jgi:hypothetical protein
MFTLSGFCEGLIVGHLSPGLTLSGLSEGLIPGGSPLL